MTQALLEIPILAGLNDEAMAELAACTHIVQAPVGRRLLLAGDPCDTVLLVRRGVVSLSLESLDGRVHILRYGRPGDPLLLGAALADAPCPASVEALSDVELLSCPAENLRSLLGRSAELGAAISRVLAEETLRLTEMVRELALHSVRVRLARFLLEHAENQPPTRRWTQDAIAATIGSVRDVIGRTLRGFAQEGLIQRSQGRMMVVDREGLESVARGD